MQILLLTKRIIYAIISEIKTKYQSHTNNTKSYAKTKCKEVNKKENTNSTWTSCRILQSLNYHIDFGFLVDFCSKDLYIIKECNHFNHMIFNRSFFSHLVFIIVFRTTSLTNLPLSSNISGKFIGITWIMA